MKNRTNLKFFNFQSSSLLFIFLYTRNHPNNNMFRADTGPAPTFLLDYTMGGAPTAFATYFKFWAYAIRPYLYSPLFKFKNSGTVPFCYSTKEGLSLEFFSDIYIFYLLFLHKATIPRTITNIIVTIRITNVIFPISQLIYCRSIYI